jgi:uncharacterized lipoprotein YmbA
MIKCCVILQLLFALAIAGLSGCGTSTPSRFYTLELTARSESVPATDISVAVGPVTLPASVDRPQFLIQAGPNRVTIDEYDRWAAPLDDSISRVVAGDLAILLGTQRVFQSSSASFNPAFRVTIDVQRFESAPSQYALIEALWTVRRMADGQINTGHTLAREPVQGKDFDLLAAAHSRALEQLSRDIAAAIKGSAEKP